MSNFLINLFFPWIDCALQLGFEEYLGSESYNKRASFRDHYFAVSMFLQETDVWIGKAWKNNWKRILFFPFGTKFNPYMLEGVE